MFRDCELCGRKHKGPCYVEAPSKAVPEKIKPTPAVDTSLPEKPSDEARKAARKEYKRKYMRDWMRRKRKEGK